MTIRIVKIVADGGRNKLEAYNPYFSLRAYQILILLLVSIYYRRAILAACNCSVPIMTHHSFSSIPVTGHSSDVLHVTDLDCKLI